MKNIFKIIKYFSLSTFFAKLLGHMKRTYIKKYQIFGHIFLMA